VVAGDIALVLEKIEVEAYEQVIEKLPGMSRNSWSFLTP